MNWLGLEKFQNLVSFLENISIVYGYRVIFGEYIHCVWITRDFWRIYTLCMDIAKFLESISILYGYRVIFGHPQHEQEKNSNVPLSC
jgi:hypothetical protein